ncbi:MAG: EAL domain-containing protein [Thermoleophilia bacterium]|nr:EAL domain-containing protein [Thermoleophilia bacterium]
MSSDACAILDNGRFIRANHTWREIVGPSREQLIGRHWRDLLEPEDAARLSEAMAAAAADDGRLVDIETQVKHADGTHRWLVWSGYTDSGRWLLSVKNITDRRRTFEKIRLQAQLLNAVEAAVIASDLEGAITEWSGGAERMLGWASGEIVGHPIMATTVTPENAAHAERVLQIIKRDGRWEGELNVCRKDGTTLPALVHSTLYRTEEGDPAGFVSVVVDLTEQVQAKRNLEVAHDYLRAVAESMGEALCTVSEAGQLIYMNRAAEELLGWRREEAIGRNPHDLFHYRRPDGSPYPAEECPLSRALDSGEAVRVDDDLFLHKDGSEIPVAYSAAPSQAEAGGRDLVVVIRDITQRKAKERELADKLESMSWVGRIRDALAEDRFGVYAQPIVDLGSRETRQHELLIRMIGQDGSIILPGEFLPAAEEYLAIRDIDRWMVAQAARLAAEDHPVSVNLSAQSVTADGMLDHIRSELRRAGADPALVSIEITETAFIADEKAARGFLERLEDLGCKVALDDFGTGYGSFSHLKQLPVDCLKIDREFIQDLATDESSRHVVMAIVSLAKGFGQFTIAEGAEDEATLRELRKLGVDCVQGFTVGRPRPVSEVFGERTGD